MIDWKCNKCGSEETVEVILHTNTHYGKLKCKGCNKWIKWLSDPEKKSHKEQCAEAVEAVKQLGLRNSFIDSLISQFEKKGTLSPRQLECLEENING